MLYSSALVQHHKDARKRLSLEIKGKAGTGKSNLADRSQSGPEDALGAELGTRPSHQPQTQAL